MIGSRTRLLSLFGAALLAVTAVAPASAYTVKSDQDPSDSYELIDESGSPGVRCTYESSTTNTSMGSSYLLDKIRIRAPKNFHHYTSARNWVGWRYIIKRQPDFVGSFNEVYRSPVYKTKANDNTDPAQFSNRTWTAPEAFSRIKGNWKVWVVLFWFKPGSSTVVRSKHVLELDYYAVRGGGVDTERQDSCNGAN
jgi:hypothetical protein